MNRKSITIFSIFLFLVSTSVTYANPLNGVYEIDSANAPLQYATFPNIYLASGWKKPDASKYQQFKGAQSSGILAANFYAEIRNNQINILTKSGFQVEIKKDGTKVAIQTRGIILTGSQCSEEQYPDGALQSTDLSLTDTVSAITVSFGPQGLLLTDPGERIYLHITEEVISLGNADDQSPLYQENHNYFWCLPEVGDEVALAFYTFDYQAGANDCDLTADEVSLYYYNPKEIGLINSIPQNDINPGSITANKLNIFLSTPLDDAIAGVFSQNEKSTTTVTGESIQLELEQLDVGHLSIHNGIPGANSRQNPSVTISDSELDSAFFNGDFKVLRWDGTSMATPMVYSGNIDRLTTSCSDVTISPFQKGEIRNMITYPCFPNE